MWWAGTRSRAPATDRSCAGPTATAERYFCAWPALPRSAPRFGGAEECGFGIDRASRDRFHRPLQIAEQCGVPLPAGFLVRISHYQPGGVAGDLETDRGRAGAELESDQCGLGLRPDQNGARAVVVGGLVVARPVRPHVTGPIHLAQPQETNRTGPRFRQELNLHHRAQVRVEKWQCGDDTSALNSRYRFRFPRGAPRAPPQSRERAERFVPGAAINDLSGDVRFDLSAAHLGPNEVADAVPDRS